MRLRQLDALRAVAVLLVIGRHMEAYPKDVDANFLMKGLRGVMVLWMRCGWSGVDLFFVLSGFLVAGLLFSEYKKYGEVRLLRFFIRRGLKIYPPFYTFLVISVLVSLLGGQSNGRLTNFPVNGGSIFFEATFFQNYGSAIWFHTWSLAIEEHFYIMVGLLILFLARKRRQDTFRPLVPTFVAVATLLMIFRFVTIAFLHKDHPGEANGNATHLRVDELFFGVLLAYFYHFHQERLAAFVNKWLGLILVVSLGLFSTTLVLGLSSDFSTTGIFYWMTIGLPALSLGFGGILLSSLYWRKKSPFLVDKGLSLLAGIGVYSYSIYLWHLPAKKWLVGDRASSGIARWLYRGKLPYLIEFPLYAVGSIVVGIVMAKLIEIPVLKLRDRLFPSRSAALPASAGGAPSTESSNRKDG